MVDLVRDRESVSLPVPVSPEIAYCVPLLPDTGVTPVMLEPVGHLPLGKTDWR